MTNYSRSEQLIHIVERAVSRAYRAESGIPASSEVLWMRGMSSHRVRHFLNDLCAHGPMAYLEIGTWTGSTFCSALYGNHHAHGTAIDNFSQFNQELNPKQELQANLQRFGGDLGPHQIIEGDCLTMPLESIARAFNVFFYDGDHGLQPTAQAIRRFLPLMRRPFILVVDDWELNDEVSQGTKRALDSLKVYRGWHLPRAHGFHEGVAAFVAESAASMLGSLTGKVQSLLGGASRRPLLVREEAPS